MDGPVGAGRLVDDLVRGAVGAEDRGRLLGGIDDPGVAAPREPGGIEVELELLRVGGEVLLHGL
eukprot:14196658-Alexandrium_andersonii.AAC.1